MDTTYSAARLKSAVFGLGVFLSLAHLPLANAQESTPRSKGWTSDDMMGVKDIADVSVSPDGRRVVFTVTEPVMTDEQSEYLKQIHLTSANGSGERQITFGAKSNTRPQWSPDGRSIAFTSDRSGKNNLWVMPSDGGEAQQLTDVKTGVGRFKWAPDGTRIAFTMSDPPTEAEEKARKGKDDARVVDDNLKMNRLWVIQIEKDAGGKREPKLLTKENFNVGNRLTLHNIFDWSPSGNSIVFAHTPTPRVDDAYVGDISTIDVSTGQVTPIARTDLIEVQPLYSPDGQSIAYMASESPLTRAFSVYDVMVVSASGGKPRKLAATFDRLAYLTNANLVGWSADNRSIYFIETHGTMSRLSALPVNGDPPQELDKTEHTTYSVSLNGSRSMFGFTAESSSRPAEGYISATSRFAPAQVTHANATLLNLPWGRTEIIHWKSSDGLAIEGLLTYPAGYEAGKRYPLLLVIHGGPAGVFEQWFIGDQDLYPVAAFAARDYAVLRCNPRGSSGYGRDFRYAVYKDWGGMDYRDLMSGVDHVIRMGVADEERMGVMGFSYGGYMAAWIITQNKRFKAASVGAGISNVTSFAGTSDLNFVSVYFGGAIWEQGDLYLERSPLSHIKGVSTPTLILHGEADPRVPISQGYELYNALKRQGVPVKMVVYPRAPHGPEEPKQLLDFTKRNVEWFDQYLRGDQVGSR